MDLINRDNVTKALRLDKVGLQFLSRPIYKLFGMERANTFYHKHAGQPSPEFIDALFDDLDVKVDIGPEGQARIPSEGPFWLIGNHPLGIWDGLILMKLLKGSQPEYKVITLFFLERLQELRPHIVPVNSWQDKKDMGGNHSSMKEIFQTIRSGHPIGLFPAGSVSRWNWAFRRVTDVPWNPTAIKMMGKFDIPVVPIFIHGRNSRFFYVLAFLSHTLRRGRNFGEFFNKKGRTLRVEIGEPIPPATWKAYTDVEARSDFFREKVFELGRS